MVEWLRKLIALGAIAPGDVDERSILDVQPDDLVGYDQHHFFAGVGTWSYALRRAGWPDARPVWTGSCPCQPFSVAGKAKGFRDLRHLWPHWHRLIRESLPDIVFGEQVASRDGLAWLDLVCADLEGAGYAIGACDSCASGYGAPHIRQRLYFVAHAQWRRCQQRDKDERELLIPHPHRVVGGVGITRESGLEGHARDGDDGNESRRFGSEPDRPVAPAGCVGGFWGNAEWIWCRDEKFRPAEPGTFPLAHGAAARVGRLRGYGNALVAPQAEAFIRAYMEICDRAG